MNTPAALTGFEAFDQLATMVAIVSPEGHCLLANSALENTLGHSRRALQRGSVFDWLAEPAALRDTLLLVASNHVATSRFEALMRRGPLGASGLNSAGVGGSAGPGHGAGDLPVHGTVEREAHLSHASLPGRGSWVVGPR